jgi:predicted RND superfamily exporter protein
VSLGLGFFVFLIADMNVLRTFGVLTGLTIIIALLADLTITPALMALMYRSKEEEATQTATLAESGMY